MVNDNVKPPYVWPDESSPAGNAFVIRGQVRRILQIQVSKQVAEEFSNRAKETRYKDLKALVKEYCELVRPVYVPDDDPPEDSSEYIPGDYDND